MSDPSTSTNTSNETGADAQTTNLGTFHLKDSPVHGAGSYNIDVKANVEHTATGTNTTGSSTGTNLSYGTAGIINSPTTIGGQLDVRSGEHSQLIASATSVSGDATAASKNDLDGTGVTGVIEEGIQKTGGIIDSDLGAGKGLTTPGIGGSLGLDVTASNHTSATANATTGVAHATAQENTAYGVLNSDIRVNGNLQRYTPHGLDEDGHPVPVVDTDASDHPATVKVTDSVSSIANTFTGSDSSGDYDAEAHSTRKEVTGMRFGQEEDFLGEDHPTGDAVVGKELSVKGNAKLDVTVGTLNQEHAPDLESYKPITDGYAPLKVGSEESSKPDSSSGILEWIVAKPAEEEAEIPAEVDEPVEVWPEPARNMVHANANVHGHGDASASVSTDFNYGITGDQSSYDGPGLSYNPDQSGGRNWFKLRLNQPLNGNEGVVLKGLSIKGLPGFRGDLTGFNIRYFFYNDENNSLDLNVVGIPETSDVVVGNPTDRRKDVIVPLQSFSSAPTQDAMLPGIGSLDKTYNYIAFIVETRNFPGKMLPQLDEITISGLETLDGIPLINSNGATIYVGGHADLTAEVANEYSSTATSVSGNATATANTSGGSDSYIGYGETIAIDAHSIEVKGGANLKGLVDNETKVHASTHHGDVDATSVSGQQIGISSFDTNISGGPAKIQGWVRNYQSATASTTDAATNAGAKALAKADQTSGVRTGINADGDETTLETHGSTIILADGGVIQVADAEAIKGAADARAFIDRDTQGWESEGIVNVGGDLQVKANALADLKSAAKNYSPLDSHDDATVSRAEIDADVYGMQIEDAFYIGEDLDVEANAYVELDAKATSTNSDVFASSEIDDSDDDVHAATFEGAVDIKGGATIVAKTNVSAISSAHTVSASNVREVNSKSESELEGDIGGLDFNSDEDGKVPTVKVKEVAHLEGEANVVAHSTSNVSHEGSSQARVIFQGEDNDTFGAYFNADAGTADEINLTKATIKGTVNIHMQSGATSNDGKATALVEHSGEITGVEGDSGTDLQASKLTGMGFATVDGEASATTHSHDDAHATAKIDTLKAFEWDDDIRVSSDSSLTGNGTVKLRTTAHNTDHDATADSVQEGVVRGVDLNQAYEVHGNSTINGHAEVDLISEASSIDDDAHANSESKKSVVGVEFDGDHQRVIDIAGDSTIYGSVSTTAHATATSSQNAADAEATAHEGVGIDIENDAKKPDFNVGQLATFSATNTVQLDATAKTVEDNEGDDRKVVDADIESGRQFGMRSDTEGGKTTDLKAAKMMATGTVTVNGDAKASAMTVSNEDDSDDEVDADASSDVTRGINLADFQVSADATLIGYATTNMGSSAITHEGNAKASTDLNKHGTAAGIDIEDSSYGGKVTLHGEAHTTARAIAKSTSNNEGSPDNGTSTAKAIDKKGTIGVTVGSNSHDVLDTATAHITGHGSSVTNAYARHIGDGDTNGNATATAQQKDSVRGVFIRNLESKSDATIEGSSTLYDTARAVTVDGKATAEAGSEVGTIGTVSGILHIGSYLTETGAATANVSSHAESTLGNAVANSRVGVPGNAPPASGVAAVLSFANTTVGADAKIEGKATSDIDAKAKTIGADPTSYSAAANAYASNTGGVIAFGTDVFSGSLDLDGTGILYQDASAEIDSGVAARAASGTDTHTPANLLDPRTGSNIYGARLVGDKSSHGEGSIHGTAKGYLSATSHITTDVDGGSTSIYKFDPNTDSYAYSGFASAQGIQITGNNVPHTARDAFGDAHVTLGSGYDHEIKAVTPGSLNGFAYINSEASTTATTGNAVSASGNVYRVESVVPSPSYEAYTPISNVFTPSPETGVGNSTGVLGINLDGDVTINGPSDIQGRAQVGYMTEEGEVIAGNVASSYTHTGDAQASADLDQVIGISTSAGRELDQGAHPPMTAKIVGVSDINLNGNSTIFAQGFAVNHASAHSTTGSDPYVGGSSADSGTERTIGLDLLAGRINVHGDLHLESRAYSNDTSEASSVHGIALSNASGALGTAAILGGLGLASDPKYPEQDLAPSIDISANATSFEAHATSYDSAYSETYTGNAIAAAGFELLLDGGSGAHTNGYPDISFFPLVATAGVFDTDIAIHGNATHGIAISGYRNDVAEAQTTTGNALAGAGYAFNGDGYFDMYGTTPFTIVPTAYSFGASGSDIIVRGDVGTLEEAEGGLRLHSGAHGSASAHTGYGIAYANVSEATIGYQTNDFLQDRSEYPSQISIGSGDIQIVAQIDSVNAQAFSGSGDGSSEDFSVTVGGNHVSIPSFDALASVQGTAIGAGTWADDVLARSGSMVPGDPTVASIQNSPLQISITGNGDIDVHGQILGGQASASGTTADVRAKAGLNAFGLQMIDDFNPHEEDRSSVSIGGTGDLSASASIGSSEQAFSVSANTVYGAATAINDGGNAFPFMYVGGILGFDLEHPGPGSGQVSVKDGDITATGYANVATSSTTHGGGDSTASNIANVFGIAETDILGGQTSGSSVSGKGIGEFTTIASNTTGNATASSTVNGAGIIGDGVSIISGGALSSNPNTLSVNGNIEGIAHISNTVMAHTVYGNATATATGGAVGISGMDISSTGGGVLSGIASNTQVAMASSIYSESMD